MGTPSATKEQVRGSAADLSHETAVEIVAMLESLERFTPEDIALCTGALLDKLRAVPVRDTIYLDPYSRNLFVHGKAVTNAEQRHRIVSACIALRTNAAWHLVKSKVELAANITARNASTVDDLVFGKAALWFIQELDKVLEGIAGDDGDSSADDDE